MVGVGGARGGGVGGHGNISVHPPRILSKFDARYASLALLAILHDLPDNCMKSLPKFTGEGDFTTTKHIAFFDQFVDILGVEHEYVYIILLVQTFEGQVITWFRGLPMDSIPSYNDLETSFLRQWGEKKDHLYYLTEFGALRKKTSKSVLEFIQIFNKLYDKIPAEVKPSQPAAKVTFEGSFDSDFSLCLRERRSTTLVDM
jgi:hypothetical protein